MSEKLNRDFTRYEAMATDELEEILRLDAEAPEGTESDTELILYILEVLSRRSSENITGNTPQKAWESFEQNYMSEETPAKPKKTAFRIRRLAAAAAAVALLVAIPISTSALTLQDAWNIFARWARETFCFVSDENMEHSVPSPADQRDFASLQDMLRESNRDPSIVPTWMPEGFVLEKIEKDVSPLMEIYTILCVDGSRELRMQIKTYLPEDMRNNEVESDFAEVYLHNGIDYYIFQNQDHLRAIWVIDSCECLISGNLSVEELKMIIDSIQKGE